MLFPKAPIHCDLKARLQKQRDSTQTARLENVTSLRGVQMSRGFLEGRPREQTHLNHSLLYADCGGHRDKGPRAGQPVSEAHAQPPVGFLRKSLSFSRLPTLQVNSQPPVGLKPPSEKLLVGGLAPYSDRRKKEVSGFLFKGFLKNKRTGEATRGMAATVSHSEAKPKHAQAVLTRDRPQKS